MKIKDIRSFRGPVQYLIKYIPKLSEKTAPIRELLKKEYSWSWEEKLAKAFNEITAKLGHPENLANFNPLHESIFACDASTYGLGATIQQVDPEGNRNIIA